MGANNDCALVRRAQLLPRKRETLQRGTAVRNHLFWHSIIPGLERDMKELSRRVDALRGEREQLRKDLIEVRAECRTAAAVREQLEERLRAASHAATERATRAQGTRNRIATQGPRRSRRSPRSTTHPAK
jgi:chromosome segregation ATPase